MSTTSSNAKTFFHEHTERTYAIALAAVALMRFVNLGFLDLQAWDEALYAVRAETIAQFGAILDQTPFSIGGLYSSLHPPLYVWLTSVSFLLFGVTEFAARFFSAIFGGLTLFVIYKIGKELQGPRVGFIAALLFGLNPFTSFYARQGQFDATLVFFLSLAVLCLIRLELRGGLRFAVLAGIAVGAGLMTKLFVAFGIPFTYFFWKASTDDNKTFWKPLALSLVLAFVVAAPWYIYITIARGNSNPLFILQASALVERSLGGVEGNVKSLEVLYFVNQLFVLFPLGVIWFIAGMYRVLKDRDTTWMFLAIWFLVFFVVFTLMRTKLAVYLLPMLVPASLIAARAIDATESGKYSSRTIALCLGATGTAFLWASNQAWRNATKNLFSTLWKAHMLSMSEVAGFSPFVIILCSIILITFALYQRGTCKSLGRLMGAIILVPAFITCVYPILVLDRSEYNDGARDLANFLAEQQGSMLIVVGFDRNPQLTYYLDGADIGWRDDVELKRLKPPSERSQLKRWLADQTKSLPGDVLVIVEKDKFIRYEWVTAQELNPPDYRLVFDSRRYAVFQRKPSTVLAGLTSPGLP